jgi:hypothetical protein
LTALRHFLPGFITEIAKKVSPLPPKSTECET